jgi:hypothetical protein
MASPAINRLNAQHSTGPTSIEGKAVTRFNAMKHGLDAASLVIPGEDPGELARLAEDFHRDYAPKGAIEIELVKIIVRSTWFQHRYARLEAQLFQTIIGKMEDPATATLADAYYQDAAGANVMGKLFRRQQAAKRDFDKAVAELRRVQDIRQALEFFQTPVPASPQPRVQPTPAPVAGRHPKPVPGQPWVGSEPPSWRL